MKTVTISPSKIMKTFLIVIGIILIYFVIIHSWIHYFMYEYPELSPFFEQESPLMYRLFRFFSAWIGGFFVLFLILATLDGKYDYVQWKVKIPTFFIIDNSDKDEIIEMYKKAASYAAEGKQHLADEIYDLINKMENK